MKKILALILAFLMTLTLFTACSEEKPKKKDESKAPAESSESVEASESSTEGDSEETDITASSDNAEDESADGASSDEDTSFESDDQGDVSVNKEYDSALLGYWHTETEVSVLVFKFEENGKGKASTEGMVSDLEWYNNGGKLTVNVSYYGITENIVTDADYVVEGDSLTITFEDSPLILTKGEYQGGESVDTDDVNTEKEYDTILLGTWGYFEDGVAMLITFEENGKGKAREAGRTLSLEWFTKGDMLSATLSVLDKKETLFVDAKYSVDVDKLFVTVNDEVIILAKDTTDDKNNNDNNETSESTKPVKGYDSVLLGTWTATDGNGLKMTITFEEEGVGFVRMEENNEERSFYIDWYTSNGILEATITEMGGVEINEPFGSFRYEITRLGLELTEDGDTLIFEFVA